jgi:hypothetical protein
VAVKRIILHEYHAQHAKAQAELATRKAKKRMKHQPLCRTRDAGRAYWKGFVRPIASAALWSNDDKYLSRSVRI